jgi:hypothetical protein
MGTATLTGSTNDNVVTVTGANAIQGEAKLTFDGSTLINAQDAGAASEIKASAATVYTKIIADDASGFSAIDYSHDLRFKDAGTEKWRIDTSGNILPSSTSQGVYLGVTTATAANLLDDYEEGTFTPAWSVAGGGSLGVAPSTNLGFYTKVGRMCTISIYSYILATSGTITSYSCTNLPFTSEANTYGSSMGQEYGQTGQGTLGMVDASSTSVKISKYDGGSPPANAYMRLGITYQTT